MIKRKLVKTKSNIGFVCIFIKKKKIIAGLLKEK